MAPVPRPRTRILPAFLDGWRRVLGAPVIAASTLLATFVLALPLALVMHDTIEAHLGSSLEAERAAAGWNAGWAAEFAAQAQGLGRTFTHEVIGFGGTLAIISDIADPEALTPALAIAAAVSIALWVFLSGGILDRLARARPVRAGHFFSACGVYGIRFLRLAVLIGAAYWVLFRWVHPYLFGPLYHRLTRDLSEERDGMVVRGLLYLVFAAGVALVNLVADFAKVRAVVEDRHSMIGAIGASWRFIRRRKAPVIGLYLLNVLAFLVILRLWLSLAPAAGEPTWFAFLLAEIYLLVRVWARLAFMASEVAFFQSELAHAHYTAAPDPIWPDSPAVEGIENMTRL